MAEAENLLKTVRMKVRNADDSVIRQSVQDSVVITVPIDSTLTISGAAADARATGQAIAAKASETDVKSQLSVNGRTGGGGWAIMVNGDNIPAQSDSDSESVAEALDRIGTALATETAARENASGISIPISESDSTKIKTYIDNGLGKILTAYRFAFEYVADGVFTNMGLSNTEITASHVVLGYQFYDANGNPTSDILANITWTTTDLGGLNLTVQALATGSVVLILGYPNNLTPGGDS